MKKVIGLLSAIALALGVFLAVNTVTPENNSELSLSSLTSLTTANAYCVTGVGVIPVYQTYRYICGYNEDEESGVTTPIYCSRRVIVRYDDRDNNGECYGDECWTGEGDVYDCYSR